MIIQGSPRTGNPFSPAFGASPYVLAGRDDALLDVRDGLLEGIGSPYRVNTFVGPRGSGKTVLLDAAAHTANELGWVVVDVSASPEMNEEVVDLALARTEHLVETSTMRLPPQNPIRSGQEPGWRVQMERILTVIEQYRSGILFTIDEVSDAHEALQTFCKRYQHFVRDGRNVALCLAGLPLNVEAFESLPDTSFVRRATRHQLDNISTTAVREALRVTLVSSGKHIDSDAVRKAAEATQGYPFLIQLIGYYTWRAASDRRITIADVDRGIEEARQHITESLHTSSMTDLSSQDKAFLVAMSSDIGPSKMADICTRLGWTAPYAGAYRTRLINAGMIWPAGHGLVEFAFPYLGDFVRENAHSLATPRSIVIRRLTRP